MEQNCFCLGCMIERGGVHQSEYVSGVSSSQTISEMLEESMRIFKEGQATPITDLKSSPYSIKVEVKDGVSTLAGFGIGTEMPKPEPRPFVIVDGVTYLNATMIAENTL